MRVWVAFHRGAFHGEDMPPGPSSFVGVYASREEALDACWPKGDPLFVEARDISEPADASAFTTKDEGR